MSANSYKTPASNIELAEDSPSTSVIMPSTRWVVVIFMLFAFAIFGHTIGVTGKRSIVIDPQWKEALSLSFTAVTLLLMYGVATLRKGHVIVSGFILIVIGIYEASTKLLLISKGAAMVPVIMITVIYLAPCLLAAWYLLRPSFLELSTRRGKYRDMLAMQRNMAKRLQGRF